MSWLGGLFGATPAAGNSVLPVRNPPSPSTTFPLQQVVVPKNNKPNSSPALNASPSTEGATAPRDPSPIHMNVRREYVALGGSRKSGKGRKKSKKAHKGKSKKSKAKKSKAKKTKSRK
jgi:hypothetical protein